VSYFQEMEADESFQPFSVFREYFGFVPKLFKAQTLLPRLIEAEVALAKPILSKQSCSARTSSSLDAVLQAAWGDFLRTLSTALGVELDFATARPSDTALDAHENFGPYLSTQEMPEDFAAFAFLRQNFGFVPHVFRAQTLNPTAVDAEAEAMRLILFTNDHLPRRQKERILLAVSGANRNTYWVAVYAEILTLFGVPAEESYQIAADHREAKLSALDHALLDFSVKLSVHPEAFSGEDVESLRKMGFSEQQILEAAAVTAFTRFLNAVQLGSGAPPDFAPRRFFHLDGENVNLSCLESRPNAKRDAIDPDAELVQRAQAGDLGAFEVLVESHGKRVYRTLVGLLGSSEEARDAMQDTFLKAFEHLADFEGRSKFSTWLISIAGNTGLQRLRERRPMESLDDDGGNGDEGFRPRQVRAWTDDPEQLYSQAEVRSLVENCLKKLPAKYRVAILLRDFEQLSAEDAAAALGLGVPALKSRLLRGRLMLREALAPYFAKRPREAGA
jgi:RNA polymerase sigma-70 factor, ECF subfamily